MRFILVKLPPLPQLNASKYTLSQFLVYSSAKDSPRSAKNAVFSLSCILAAGPFLAKSVRNSNPKIQAFKHVLEFALSMRGAEGLGYLIFSMTSKFLQFTVVFHMDSKNVRKVIEMALKLLLLPQIHKNHPEA